MARKEIITIDMILDTAFAMTREEGFANVTARKVAARAGCSTQPIFRVYRNMDELWHAVYERAAAFFQEYYSRYPRRGNKPFANLGMAYIAFAREERHLFELLFVKEGPGSRGMYELLNGTAGNVVCEINLAKAAGCALPPAPSSSPSSSAERLFHRSAPSFWRPFHLPALSPSFPQKSLPRSYRCSRADRPSGNDGSR